MLGSASEVQSQAHYYSRPIRTARKTTSHRSLAKFWHLGQELRDIGINNPPTFFFRKVYLKSPEQYEGFCRFYEYFMGRFRGVLKESGSGNEERLSFNIIPPTMYIMMRLDFDRLIMELNVNKDKWFQFYNEHIRNIDVGVSIQGQHREGRGLRFFQFKIIEEIITQNNIEAYNLGRKERLIGLKLISDKFILSLLDVHIFLRTSSPCILNLCDGTTFN